MKIQVVIVRSNISSNNQAIRIAFLWGEFDCGKWLSALSFRNLERNEDDYRRKDFLIACHGAIKKMDRFGDEEEVENNFHNKVILSLAQFFRKSFCGFF